MPEKPIYSINPDRTKPWNDLPPLPIPEELFKDYEILKELGEAKAAIGRLQGRSIAIPNQGLFINTISLQEAKASSAIENIFTTDDELYRAFSEQNVEQIQGAPKEILRYREALWMGHAYLKQSEKFDQDYFVQMYREIKQAGDGIRAPFAAIVIKQGGTGLNAGKIIYTPPRGKDTLEAMLDNLIQFMNNEGDKLDPLLKMAISHYQFEAIHPFTDGNGRAGRIMNIHFLTQQGLLDYPILFLSRYIIDNKDAYYAGLSGISQRGDWKSWILYMLKAVKVTSNITYQKINDIIATKDAIHKLIEDETEIRRPDKLVEAIFTQPYTKVKHLVDAGIYAENTAREYLNTLTKLKVLEKKVLTGHHYYLNLELHRILSE